MEKRDTNDTRRPYWSLAGGREGLREWHRRRFEFETEDSGSSVATVYIDGAHLRLSVGDANNSRAVVLTAAEARQLAGILRAAAVTVADAKTEVDG